MRTHADLSQPGDRCSLRLDSEQSPGASHCPSQTAVPDVPARPPERDTWVRTSPDTIPFPCLSHFRFQSASVLFESDEV